MYILIHAPYTRIVVCWHISNIPPRIFWSQICYDNANIKSLSSFLLYPYMELPRFTTLFNTIVCQPLDGYSQFLIKQCIFRPPTWWASLVVSHSLTDNYVYHLWLRTFCDTIYLFEMKFLTCLIISRFLDEMSLWTIFCGTNSISVDT